MTIYCVMIEAVPSRKNSESKEYGGAYVNCWIKADAPVEAVETQTCHYRTLTHGYNL